MSAHAQEAPQAQKLEAVEVTGSRIRRVDTETASPLYTIDRSFIDKSGVQTVGQLIQELPSIAGNSTNPQVNQGATGFATAGTGASTISLRGLGDVRTLVLLDGHRFVGSGPNSTNDVNALPINVVDRIEVLKEGASAVYGSDAVGGVVNIITRKNFKGAEFTADLGTSKHSDGGRQDYSFAFGANSDKGHLLVGLNYNKQDSISAADRNFSKNALYLYSGVVSAAGSSRNPNGRIYLPVGSPGAASFSSCTPSSGLVSVTRNAGATGSAPSDYHCYSSADSFNYQAVGNVVMTPQERYGLFTSGNYDLTDKVQFYTEFFHNVTNSDSSIAPLPFDARSDDVPIASNALGNIFGTGFGGGDAVNPNLLTRFVAAGNRTYKFETLVDQINLGARGELFGWNWDGSIGYGRVDQTEHGINYLSTAKLKNAVGPSFTAADGTPTCGTPDAPISGCIPLNIFNIPGSPAGALDALTTNYSDSQVTQLKTGAFNVTGDVISLPAGKLSVAAGIEYREYILNSNVDSATTLQAPNFLNCDLPQETCSSATHGSYSSTEYYVEALIPVVKDLPGVKALNLIAGTRYSDYSNFDGTLNSKIALEWRPVGDVLTRASFSQVFRAPTITDLYSGAVIGNPTFRDPCAKTTTPVGANPNLDLTCENVVRDGSFAEPTSQITGQQTGNSALKPERGHVLTFGAVYDPNFLPGFSTSVDFWKYSLTDLIVYPDVNTAAQGCLATGNAEFCNLIHRNSDGSIAYISQPNQNLGKLSVQGVDLGFKYVLPKVVPGRVRVSLDATFLDKYDNTPIPSVPSYVNHIAGTYSRQYGQFSRWRGIGTVGWDYSGFDALWTVRFIGPFSLPNPDGSPAVISSPSLHFKSTIYDNIEAGYTIEKTKTRVGFGVDNLFNQPPPILYQNNVLNANTDVNTFDTIGTYFWLRLTQRFK
ncbi:MAG: TonB-dependent receptor [Nevskia sp.]|nr:TonB-dependent receptor [Nevskia sp.]